VQHSEQVQRSDGLKMARRIWTSAAGQREHGGELCREANRRPELSCITCLCEPGSEPTFAIPFSY
jgi:hypothetical protein